MERFEFIQKACKEGWTLIFDTDIPRPITCVSDVFENEKHKVRLILARSTIKKCDWETLKDTLLYSCRKAVLSKRKKHDKYTKRKKGE